MNYKNEIAKIINAKMDNLEIDVIENLLEVPPNKELGDYAFPCFVLAKQLKKAPVAIAQDLAGTLEKTDMLQDIVPTGPYVNFKLDRTLYSKNTIETVLQEKERYGSNEVGKGKTAVVEFSSTNIAKPFHIGHIRSTVIGNVIRNLYHFSGYKTVAINYLGDYGTQFGMIIAAYKLWGDDKAIEEAPIKELLNLYVRYNREAETDEAMMNTARDWFYRLEQKDEEATRLWSWFKTISLGEFERVYRLLGIDFDSYLGEMYNSQFIPEVLEELEEKNLLVPSEGAKIIDLADEKLPIMLVVKSNGSSTYMTRDIATAINRKKVYDFDKNIYVVGSQQNLHFQQLRAALKKMGYSWWNDCIHIPFGMISLKDETLSTRKGKIVFLEDVLNKAIEKTMGIIEDRNPDLENKDLVAKQVGIGAVIFQELFNNRIKDYVFDWDEVLNFEGETGPYVQYTLARSNSILSKGMDLDRKEIDYTKITSEEEYLLLSSIGDFPKRVLDALDKNEPSFITRQLVEIAKNFNKFYNTCPILNSDEETKKARLSIVQVTNQTLKNGLRLLGIEAPERM